MISFILRVLKDPLPFFIAISLLFGLAFVFIVPPMQSPDENSHFLRAKHITTGHLIGVSLDQRLGGLVPKNYGDYASSMATLRKADKTDFNTRWKESVAEDYSDESFKFYDFPNVGYYAPTLYIPHSIGLAFADSLNLSVASSLTTSRIFSLLFWMGIVGLGLSLIPFGKELFLLLALLPSSLVLHSSSSGDTVSNGLVFLLIAIFFYYKHGPDNRLDWLRILSIAFILVIITVNKPTLTPLALLLLLIPKSKFIGNSSLKKIALVGLPFLISMIWIQYSSGLFIPFDQYNIEFREGLQLNPGVNPLEQLGFITSEPLSFGRIAFLSYIDSIWASSAHYVGKFGWDKNYLPSFMIAWLCLWLLFLSLFHNKTDNLLNAKTRLFSIGVFILLILCFTVSIYMQWSPVQNDRVLSLSGRYLIPILPVLLFNIQNVFLKPRMDILITINRITIVVALITTCYCIFGRYY